MSTHNNWARLQEFFGSMLDSFADPLEVIATSDFITDRKQHVQEAFEALKALDRVRQDCALRSQISLQVTNALRQTETEDIEQLYTQQVEAARQRQVEEDQQAVHPAISRAQDRFGNFLTAGEAGEDDDAEDELQLTQQQSISTKCPLTQRTFRDPVKSRFCGHTFERSAAHIFAKKRKLKCPVMGCKESDRFLNVSDLVDDKRMKRIIESQMSQAE